MSRFHFSLSSDHHFSKKYKWKNKPSRDGVHVQKVIPRKESERWSAALVPASSCVWGLPEIGTAQYANQRWRSELPGVTPDAR